jgi:hypothetical protein
LAKLRLLLAFSFGNSGRKKTRAVAGLLVLKSLLKASRFFLGSAVHSCSSHAR